MSISAEKMQSALKDLGLPVETDGQHFVHTTQGRYAPLINTIMTLDEDGDGATIMSALAEIVPAGKRVTVCELLNLVHGQSLWNVRFHLDETGRVFSISKMMLWGKPFNPTQFGDIIFTSMVTTDRLYPCLRSVIEESRGAEEAFERFFLVKKPDAEPESESESDSNS